MRDSAAPIFRFNEARSSIVEEVVSRVGASTKDPLYTLSDAAYLEVRRLASSGGAELAEWRHLASSLGRMSEAERAELAKTP